MANGILDFLKTPEGQGLLSAAFGGLAGARPNAPLNTLGRAGLAGVAGYGSAIEREQMQKQMQAQQEMRDLQMQQLRTTMEAEQRKRAALPTLFQGGVTQGRVDVPEVGGVPMFSQAKVAEPAMQEAPKFDVQGAIKTGLFTPQEIQAYASLQNIGKPEEKVYKPGDVVYRDGKQVMAIPKETEMPADVKAYEYAVKQGYKGPFVQFQTDLKRAGASRTNITMGQEKAEAQVVGKAFGEQYADIQKAGFNAQSAINRYDRLGQLLEGVNTGKFSPLGLEIAKAAQAAGINIDPKLSNKEAAAALSNEIALQLRNPAGGAGMPGALSDKDREFLVSMVPGLATTPQGRALMLETGKKLAKRDQEVARLAREYRKKNGSLDEGFYEILSDYANKNPLFQSAPQQSKGGARFLGFE